jgi:glycosyltransferase involved in cell wall biosynthesis
MAELTTDRRAGPTSTSTRIERRLWVVNPLGAALHHYSTELADVLVAAGTAPSVLAVTEPSSSGASRWAWTRSYLAALRAVRRAWTPGDRVVVTWPVLGYLDVPLIAAVLGHRASLVVHDTRPLTSAVGYHRVWQGLAVVLDRWVEVVVHSHQARDDLQSPGLTRRATLLPHPVLAPQPSADTAPPAASPASRECPVVRVLGQFKPDRDVPGLAALAAELDGRCRLEIVGRGWPAVPGWAVRDAFVPEGELDELLATSDAVVIPYRRFYQSGVALRALEHGVPVVGPAASSLATLCGPSSRLLVGPDGWAESVAYAVSPDGRAEARDIARRWRAHAVAVWSAWAGIEPGRTREGTRAPCRAS